MIPINRFVKRIGIPFLKMKAITDRRKMEMDILLERYSFLDKYNLRYCVAVDGNMRNVTERKSRLQRGDAIVLHSVVSRVIN